MELIDSLLRAYEISPERIPVSTWEINRIDLEGKIQINDGDLQRGIRMKIIGAVGYFRQGEFFEAAHSFERATKATRNV